jgi:hypothetical protein
MTFPPIPPMPDWFPDFVTEIAALSPAELRELNALLAEDEARAEAAKKADAPLPVKRRRRVTLAAALKQAAKTGVPVSAAVIGSDGVTLHSGKTEQATDLNPWDEVLPREPN